MMKFKLFFVMIFLAIVCCYGCSMFQAPDNFTPEQKVEYTTLQTLKAAKDFRIFALKSAGSLYKKGLMSEDTKNEIIKIGDELQKAINDAADALALYHQTGGLKSEILEEKIMAYQSLFNKFLEIATPYMIDEEDKL